MAAGDLNGDQLDDLVIAAPDSAGEHCLLSSARVVDGQLLADAPLVLDPVCSRETQLALTDLDGDGAAELIVLTGPVDGPRRLLVLWNDGAGALSPAEMSSLTSDDESPRGFALYRPTPHSAFALAYVTEHAVRVLDARQGARGFAPDARDIGLDLERGTGIVATDVDGDGVTDLVVADAGSLRVLRAELEP
jgi:hypothetical protein